ncbi:MAG: iron-sulfur cluster repair di-iron protein [Calditrichia bacterium]
METTDILDVRLLKSGEKHTEIFDRFSQMAQGEKFILVNDHDPKPLFYKFSKERPGEFSWNYLEEGPEAWKVQIARLEKPVEETLGKIVTRDFRTAEVFKRYGLDFCCGGKKTVTEACEEKGIDPDKVRAALQEMEGILEMNSVNHFDTWELDFLADYIVNNHHAYVRRALAELPQYLSKLVEAHGATHHELSRINEMFSAVKIELESHMMKEERILFPYIRQLAAAKRNGGSAPVPGFGTIENPVRMMEAEHQSAGEAMEEISRLSGNYKLPADGCATYSMVYSELKAFEDDLHQHIHLENNILFPKAIDLEKKML